MLYRFILNHLKSIFVVWCIIVIILCEDFGVQRENIYTLISLYYSIFYVIFNLGNVSDVLLQESGVVL